jgi:hypothetical protein
VQPIFYRYQGENCTTENRSYQNLHRRLASPQLLHKRVKSRKYRAQRQFAPHIVSPQVHHNDIGLDLEKPAHQLVLPSDIRGQESTVALVLPVVGEATTLPRERSNKVRVLNAGVLELPPEEGSPATLLAFIS